MTFSATGGLGVYSEEICTGLCVTNSWQKSPKIQHVIPQGSTGVLVEPAGILINDLAVGDSPVMSHRESKIQSRDLT